MACTIGLASIFLLLYIHSGLYRTTIFVDEGDIFISRSIRNGSLLYRDSFQENAPLRYYLTALWGPSFDFDILKLRKLITAIAMATLTAGFLHLLTGSGIIPAALFALVFALLNPMVQGYQYLSEPFCALILVVASAWAFRMNKFNSTELIGIGFLCALSPLLKQSSILAASGIIVGLALRRREGVKGFFKTLVLCGLGAIIPHIIFTIYYALYGACTDFWHGYLYFLGPYRRELYLRAPSWFERGSVLVVAALLLTSLARLIETKLERRELPIAFAAAGSLAMLTSAYVPFHALVPSTLLLLFAAPSIKSPRKPSMWVLLISLVIVSPSFVSNYRTFFENNWRRSDAYTQISIAKQVAKLSEESKYTLVLPLEPCIYLYSGLEPASYFSFYLPWLGIPQNWQRLHDDLERTKPKIIVWTYFNDRPGVFHPREYARPLLEYISKNYRYHANLYRRLIFVRSYDCDDKCRDFNLRLLLGGGFN